MKVKALLERVFFGQRVAGEPVGEPKSSLVIPGLTPRPTEAEWKKELNVSRQYSRFDLNPTHKFYGDESPVEYNDMLRRIITGSI
jgi:hypothetical protein